MIEFMSDDNGDKLIENCQEPETPIRPSTSETPSGPSTGRDRCRCRLFTDTDEDDSDERKRKSALD